MSIVAAIYVREPAQQSGEIKRTVQKLMDTFYPDAPVREYLRVMENSGVRAEDFGVVEIDVSQSRDFDHLNFLLAVFCMLCQQTEWRIELDWGGAEVLHPKFSKYMFRDRGQAEPVVFDPDDESFEKGAA